MPAASIRSALQLLCRWQPVPSACGAGAPRARGGFPRSAVLKQPLYHSNTGVGKTLVSAGVAAQHAASGGTVFYLKPLQTGFPSDSDGDFVTRVVRRSTSAGAAVHSLGPHAAHLAGPQPSPPPAPAVTARTLFAWADAVGPHLAATREARSRAVADSEVAPAVAAELRAFVSSLGAAGAATASKAPLPLALVETAGGVCSPGPAGALQCDILRALRLPALLVGDGRLGCVPLPSMRPLQALFSMYTCLTLSHPTWLLAGCVLQGDLVHALCARRAGAQRL
jgi:hypothetical protein